MNDVYQWLWDRHGAHYSWANAVLLMLENVPSFGVAAFLILRFEHSNRYLAMTALVLVASAVTASVLLLLGPREWRIIDQWARGAQSDPREALAATYRLTRGIKGNLGGWALEVLCFCGIGALGAFVAGARGWRLGQWAVLTGAAGLSIYLHGVHSVCEGSMRPVREAMARDTAVGDDLPRARPTFATWSNVTLLTSAWAFTTLGVLFGVVIDRSDEDPLVVVAITLGVVVFLALPISVLAGATPALRPLRDLAEGTERVAAGDYTRRLPVTQDDDLGALSASFNRMQAGLAQRERLQAAFGSYVDPALAARLLDQGDDLFTGERIDVTVMFVDIRDFTPFAEANTAEDTVAHLNALFEIVVPAVLDAGGHVNKYLGDGAMAVFGAPNILANHADAAVATAQTIQRLVVERFAGTMRVGIGINTGQVIAGTIGGGGKLEFTLIGDTVNVAARIEQLTKTTGDATLLTEHTVAALTTAPEALIDRGAHALKGKSGTLRVYALG